jgi:hypothetical protein
MSSVIQDVKSQFSGLATKHQLGKKLVQVTVKPLSPREAIGNPTRKDFPILLGREVIVEAQFDNSFGQAFTDQPQNFSGTIDELLKLNLDSSSHRAIFIASLNAIASQLGIARGVRHCRDEEPEKCGSKLAGDLKQRFGDTKIGLIGLQPAILQNLSQSFGAQNVRCTDLNPKNVDSNKFGVEIWNGATETSRLIGWCRLLLATSSSITNGTLDAIYQEATSSGKHLILFGITGAAVCALTGIERICLFGH